MMRSQGHRSSSVSGWPTDILARLASGWNASPSANGTPSASRAPWRRCDFPTPETPITTTSRIGTPGTNIPVGHPRNVVPWAARWSVRAGEIAWVGLWSAQFLLGAPVSWMPLRRLVAQAVPDEHASG